MTRALDRTVGILGMAMFVLAVAYPAAALAVRLCIDRPVSATAPLLDARSMTLLARSAGLATVTAVTCHILALPAIAVLSRRRATWLLAGMLAIALCPPMVFAFGWRRLLPAAIDGYVLCIGVFALWCWPIAALLVGTAWARSGRRLYESALLDATPTGAFIYVVLPAMRRTLAFSWLIVFAFCFSDYSVPHACGLIVFPTELLGWAASATTPLEAVKPAAPSFLAIGLLCTLILYLARGTIEFSEPQRGEPLLLPRVGTIGSMALVFVSLVVPVVALVRHISSPAAIAEALRVYGHDFLWSLITAGFAGLAAAAMGWALSGRSWPARLGLVACLVVGTAPGAAVGLMLVAAYSGRWFATVYDHWPVVALSYLARFGWVGALVCLSARRRVAASLLEQAAVDGARSGEVLRWIVLPLTWPTLLGGMGVVAVLSLGDIAASSMVRVPTFSPIAHVIIEKFHRLEDDMLISLSLVLTAIGAVGVAAGTLVQTVLCRRRIREVPCYQ